MVSHCILSDSKSSQVSRTLLSILVNLNIAIVLMVSTRPHFLKSFSPGTNPLVTVPSTPITNGITVILMFHSFFTSLVRSKYLTFSFRFLSVVSRSGKVHHLAGSNYYDYLPYN